LYPQDNEGRAMNSALTIAAASCFGLVLGVAWAAREFERYA
jgi:hypothetical protein